MSEFCNETFIFFSRGKAANLATHSGFEEKLCYGDIVLTYRHQTAPLSNTERRRVEKIRQENELSSQRGDGLQAGATAARKWVLFKLYLITADSTQYELI